MQTKTFLRAATPWLLALAAGASQAADFSFSGNLGYQKDVVAIDFTLAASATEVRLFTDSWSAGLNFDPTAALWVQSGGDYQLVDTNDDNDTVGPGQGAYDSGFVLAGLAAGSYRITLGAAVNAPNGTLLSQGFLYDGDAPVLLADWVQPTSDINVGDQKGSLWSLHVNGVDSAVAAVPEPSTWALFGLGLLACGLRARRRG